MRTKGSARSGKKKIRTSISNMLEVKTLLAINGLDYLRYITIQINRNSKDKAKEACPWRLGEGKIVPQASKRIEIETQWKEDKSDTAKYSTGQILHKKNNPLEFIYILRGLW